MNAAIRRAGANWCVYGTFSGFHIFTNPDNQPVTPEDIAAGKVPAAKFKGGSALQFGGRNFTGGDVLRSYRLVVRIGEDVETGKGPVDAPVGPGAADGGVHLDRKSVV